MSGSGAQTRDASEPTTTRTLVYDGDAPERATDAATLPTASLAPSSTSMRSSTSSPPSGPPAEPTIHTCAHPGAGTGPGNRPTGASLRNTASTVARPQATARNSARACTGRSTLPVAVVEPGPD